MGSRRPRSERGAIVPLAAMLITALVLFIALAVDLGLFLIEVTNRERTAEQAALAAEKVYLDQRMGSPAASPEDAYDAALARAALIAQLNMDNLVTTRLRHGTSSALWSVGDETADTTETRLVPGRWLLDTTANATERANCDPPAVAGKGCFRPLLKTSIANSFRFSFRTPPALVLRVIFWAGLLPEDHRLVQTDAYSAMVPRNAVFLVDLSRSIVEDNYLSTAPLGTRAEYAWALDSTSGGSCTDGTNPAVGQLVSAYRNTFSALPTGTRSSGDPETEHHAGDFMCRSPGITGEPRYAIDDGNVAPQPLTDVLTALKTSLDILERRGVSDDRVGVVGFDDGMMPERMLSMIRPTDSETSFADWRTVYTNTGLPIADRVEAYLFPRPIGSRPDGAGNRLPAGSDLKMALDQAKTMISAQTGFQSSDNFIVLISDGFANCPVNRPLAPFSCFYSGSSASGLAISEAYVRAAVGDISSASYAGDFRQARIAVHVFLLGKTGGAHHLVRRSGTDCMTDNEARTALPAPYSFVDSSGGTIDPSDSSPFYFVNRLYTLPSITGGRWEPITPPCRTGANPSIEPDLNTQCGSVGTEGGLVTNYSGCPVDVSPCPVANQQFVDGAGRLLCDAKGRSVQDHVREAIEDIMKENPIMLVKPS